MGLQPGNLGTHPQSPGESREGMELGLGRVGGELHYQRSPLGGSRGRRTLRPCEAGRGLLMGSVEEPSLGWGGGESSSFPQVGAHTH